MCVWGGGGGVGRFGQCKNFPQPPIKKADIFSSRRKSSACRELRAYRVLIVFPGLTVVKEFPRPTQK